MLLLISSFLTILRAQVCQHPQRGGFKSMNTLVQQDQAVEAVEQIDTQGVLAPQQCSCEINGDTYKLTNFFLFLKYDPAYHKGIAMTNGINVTGGRLLIDFRFDFQAKHVGLDLKGVGEGRADMEDFWYLKELTINNGDLQFQLGEMHNITQNLDFSVKKVNPDSQTTLAVLESIMNHDQYCKIKETTTTNLTAELRHVLDSILRNELEIKFLTDYAWKATPFSESHHVIVNSIINKFFIMQDGIKFYSEMQVHQYNATVCGTIPELPLSTPQFGGFQTVYSLSVIQSMLMYALENQFFNLTLTKHDWQSEVFQFAVGDLAAIIPALEHYNHSQLVDGKCEWNRTVIKPSGLDVKIYNNSLVQVLVPFDCQLHLKEKKVVQIYLTSSWMIKVVPADTYVDFRMEEAYFYTIYEKVNEFEVTNKPLADFYINSLFDHIRDKKVFGSGFPVDPRKRASAIILNDSIVIFDKTAQ